MMVYTILIYLCIALIGNATYFFACQGEYPECGTVSLVFFNVSVLCQLFPTLTNKTDDEKNQKNGQFFICSTYLISEIILAGFCTLKNVDFATAGTIQILMLGIFLIVYFGVAKANEKTNKFISENRKNKSLPLLEANAQLRNAMADCQDITLKDILRESFAELNSIPMDSNELMSELDAEICNKVILLCGKPDTLKQKELSRLIHRRKAMKR